MTHGIIFATGLETAGIIGALVFGGLSCVVSIIAILKKQEVKIDQPLMMKMQEEFVPQKRFEHELQENKREHENLFKKIGGVERGAVQRLDDHLKDMQKSAEDGRDKIHRRLNRLSIGLANLCGRVGAAMPSEEEES